MTKIMAYICAFILLFLKFLDVLKAPFNIIAQVLVPIQWLLPYLEFLLFAILIASIFLIPTKKIISGSSQPKSPPTPTLFLTPLANPGNPPENPSDTERPSEEKKGKSKPNNKSKDKPIEQMTKEELLEARKKKMENLRKMGYTVYVE